MTGADFSNTTYNGFSCDQLYSTAGYGAGTAENQPQRQQLGRLGFPRPGPDQRQFLQGYTTSAIFTSANLSGADTRGAVNLPAGLESIATTQNMIWPDGHISGLQLPAGTRLIVRDYNYSYWSSDIPITVAGSMNISGGTLQMVFEDADWGSTINTPSGTTTLSGATLELGFRKGTDILSLYGAVCDLFNWNGAHNGVFTISGGGQEWDLSRLYTTGEIRLRQAPIVQQTPIGDEGLLIHSYQTVEFNAACEINNSNAPLVTEAGTGGFQGGVLRVNGGTHVVANVSGGGDTEILSGSLTANTISQHALTLNSGTVLRTNEISSAPEVTDCIVNFDGGTVKALGNDTPDHRLINNDGGATSFALNVKVGGIKIDSNGYDVTIAERLQHGAGTATDGGLTKQGRAR